MAQVSFIKSIEGFEVPEGTNLMQALLNAEVAVASSCGGEGICSKCVIRIIDGDEHLSPMNDRELDLMEKIALSEDGRVSCQTQILGDITVDTPYW